MLACRNEFVCVCARGVCMRGVCMRLCVFAGAFMYVWVSECVCECGMVLMRTLG